LVVDSPELAATVGRDFTKLLGPEYSYRLALEPHEDETRIVWHGEEDGRANESHVDPGTSWGRRFTVDLMSMLPIAGQL
jgi:putative cardiolipin synthase